MNQSDFGSLALRRDGNVLRVTLNRPHTRNAVSGLDASIALEALSNMIEDHREAVAACREKRKPKFTDR